jgi:hypothetical protein
MFPDAGLATNQRFAAALSAIGKREPRAAARDVADYAAAAAKDVRVLVGSVLPFFFPFHTTLPASIEVILDRSDLSVAIKVKRGQDGFRVTISVGAVMAIDDASCTFTRYLCPDSEVIFDNSKTLLIEAKYLDYRFLLGPLPGLSQNSVMLGIVSVVFTGESENELCVTLANLSILWLILHEAGHVRLGHFSSSFSESSVPESFYPTAGGDGKFSHRRIHPHFAIEVAADLYASLKIYSTFYRKDSIAHALPKLVRDEVTSLLFIMLAICIPSLILHRLQRSIVAGGLELDAQYPNPAVRLFGALAAAIPGTDNNRRNLRQIALLLTAANDPEFRFGRPSTRSCHHRR